MKILLIDPPFYRFIKYYNRYFPLGLTYLAAVLRSQGHDLLIYDADANVDKANEMDFTTLEDKYPQYLKGVNNLEHPIWDELRDVLNNFKPELAGVSVFTTKAASAFRTAQIVKMYDPNIPVVFGGPHPSVKAQETLEISPFVDFVVRGEGEVSFEHLAESIANKTSYSDINGISYRSGKSVYHNHDSDFIKDLDSIPFPARDLLLNKNSYTSEDLGLIMSGRGCPYQCAFCSSSGVWRRKARFRSVENVIEEIGHIHNRFGTIQFSFKDDTFTINRQRVMDFCRLLKTRKLKISWDCNARVNLIDESLLMEMKSAGCNGVKVGIESGSHHILKNVMKKNITLSQIELAADTLRKAGLHWTGYFMMGLPTETKQQILETLELMKRIKPDFASISVFEPFPGTELFGTAQRIGYVTNTRTIEDYYTISPKYYYLKDPAVHIDTMKEDEFKIIEKFMKRSFHKFNRSPARIIKRAKARSALYLLEPKMLLNDLSRFLAWLK